MENEVKQLRTALGMTQEQFADVMGVSPRTVCNWENGTKIPKAKSLHMQALKANPYTISNGVCADENGGNLTAPTDDNILLKALLKSQEQIDRLIAVIEHLTGTKFDRQ